MVPTSQQLHNAELQMPPVLEVRPFDAMRVYTLSVLPSKLSSFRGGTLLMYHVQFSRVFTIPVMTQPTQRTHKW